MNKYYNCLFQFTADKALSYQESYVRYLAMIKFFQKLVDYISYLES